MPRQNSKITIVVDKVLAEWIKRKSEQENRSVNNFIETVLLAAMKREKEEITCISRQL